jgi:hypothetical protein
VTGYDDLIAGRDSDPGAMLRDKGYDSDPVRQDLRDRSTTPEISTKRSRKVQLGTSRRQSKLFGAFVAETGVARNIPRDGARSCRAGDPWAWSGRRSETIHPPDEAIALSFGVGSQLRSSPSDPARNTASVRVLTASFKKILLTCDFTVSGEILRARAIRLLERPLPIIVRTPRSRAVSASPARLLGCAEPPPALGATRESRVPV